MRNEHTEKECPQCLKTFSVSSLKQHLKNTKCRPNYKKEKGGTNNAVDITLPVEKNSTDDSVPDNITGIKDLISNNVTSEEVTRTKIVPSFVTAKEELICFLTIKFIYAVL